MWLGTGLIMVANNRTKASAVRWEDTGILLPTFARRTLLVVQNFVTTQRTAQTRIGASGHTMDVRTATPMVEPAVIQCLLY